MLSPRTVKIFRSIKHEANRPEWKSKRLSPGQVSVLARHINLDDIVTLNRGTGSLLIDCIFKLRDEDENITDITMLEELNKILYD